MLTQNTSQAFLSHLDIMISHSSLYTCPFLLYHTHWLQELTVHLLHTFSQTSITNRQSYNRSWPISLSGYCQPTLLSWEASVFQWSKTKKKKQNTLAHALWILGWVLFSRQSVIYMSFWLQLWIFILIDLIELSDEFDLSPLSNPSIQQHYNWKAWSLQRVLNITSLSKAMREGSNSKSIITEERKIKVIAQRKLLLQSDTWFHPLCFSCQWEAKNIYYYTL